MMGWVMVVMTRRMSMLITLGTWYACRSCSSIVAIIVEDVTFVLHPLWSPSLL